MHGLFGRCEVVTFCWRKLLLQVFVLRSVVSSLAGILGLRGLKPKEGVTPKVVRIEYPPFQQMLKMCVSKLHLVVQSDTLFEVTLCPAHNLLYSLRASFPCGFMHGFIGLCSSKGGRGFSFPNQCLYISLNCLSSVLKLCCRCCVCGVVTVSVLMLLCYCVLNVCS